MMIEKQREAEEARRKGQAVKTIIQTIWLLISFVGAYFFVQILFDQNIISTTAFGATWDVLANVPRWVYEWVFIFLIVLGMQFIFVLGYVMASPMGRQRAGQPTIHSNNPDPLDNQYR